MKSIRELGVAPLEFHLSSESKEEFDENMDDNEIVDLSNEEMRLDFLKNTNQLKPYADTRKASWAYAVEIEIPEKTQSGKSKPTWSSIVKQTILRIGWNHL